MTARIKNLGKNLQKGDCAVDIVTGFPVRVQGIFNSPYIKYCQFFGIQEGFGHFYTKNLKPITEEDFKALASQKLTAKGFYYQPTNYHWAVYDKAGNMVCVTGYKKGAVHTVYRLNLLAEMGHSIIRYIKYSVGSNSFSAKRMMHAVFDALEQAEGICPINETENSHENQ